jgi:hypothetical protein
MITPKQAAAMKIPFHDQTQLRDGRGSIPMKAKSFPSNGRGAT